MPNLSLKAEQDDAEKLWSYILAYRKTMCKGRVTTDNRAAGESVTFAVLPNLEEAKTVHKRTKPKNTLP